MQVGWWGLLPQAVFLQPTQSQRPTQEGPMTLLFMGSKITKILPIKSDIVAEKSSLDKLENR